MRKFILNISTLLTIVFITLFTVYKSKNDAFEKYKSKSKYDIVNFGTSHGYSFDYSDFPIKGESFCIAANTPYYDLQHYLHLKPNLNDSAIIILPISYFSFGLDENRTDRGIDNPFTNRFYEYLKFNQIYDYSITKHIEIFAHRVQSNFQSFFNEKQVYKEYKINHEVKKTTLIKASKERAEHHIKIFKHENVEKNLMYYNLLIEDALKSGFKPVLTTTPYFEFYNSNFEDEWLSSNFYLHILSIQNKYNLSYLDYSHDSILSKNHLHFKDSDHLNMLGSKEFNSKFLNDLKVSNMMQ